MAARGDAEEDGFTVDDAGMLAEAVGALRMAGVGRGGKVAVTVELSELEALALRYRGRRELQRVNRVRSALGFKEEPISESEALQRQVQNMVGEMAGRELDSLLARLLDAATAEE